MAETFKNAKKVLTGTVSDVYTVPSATTAIIIGCQVTNVDSSSRDLTFSWSDASDSDTETYLADAITIPVAASYEPIGGKLILEAGDKLRGFGSTTDTLEVTVSVLELS
jgi:hypothetical protein